MSIKSNLIYICLLLLSIPFISFAQTEESLEYLIHDAEICTEKGLSDSDFTTYFFPRGKVIARCVGDCESDPQVLEGEWEIVDDYVEIQYHTEWIAEGRGQVTTSAEMTMYEYYVAAKNEVDYTHKMYKPWNQASQDCAEVQKKTYLDDDIHRMLHNNGRETYPETRKHVLYSRELEKYSKAELRIMRNEIFARYGYSFKSKDLREYFNERGFYGGIKDVSAFLSDIEKANVENIRMVEKEK